MSATRSVTVLAYVKVSNRRSGDQFRRMEAFEIADQVIENVTFPSAML